ncbi:NlpC/P60 family protein [Halobacillus karajensis]|uniref:C40 family peptidase n=1 Tax=Halobacillus karajensis TaxID=195088 RepID=UPI0008A7377C|nr:C40 family peptidase [Halobacillus karajensis]SEH69308.1 NlpC/P60 family protein [Halobacillus karajensis]
MAYTKSTNTIWVVRVPVATVWTSPDSPREIDEKGLSASASIKDWLKVLNIENKRALCDDNLVQSQLLLGEEVLLEERTDSWAKVIVPTQPSSKDARGYPGYVPANQIVEVTSEEWTEKKKAVVQRKHTALLDEEKNPVMEVSYLTALPVVEKQGAFVRVLSPDGEGFVSSADVSILSPSDQKTKGNGEDLIRAGESFVGLPYFWGGMSAYGYDCSGFAYNMHKAFHYQIPRDASDQARGGKEIPLDQVQPGDLLFFAYEEGKGRIHHVGFYYGNGKMLHSPNVGKSIEIIDLAGTVYEKEQCAARRYWQEGEKSS